MIAKLVLHPDQIRWWVQSAMSGFDTLDPADAVEHARADLVALLEYLELFDGADDAVSIAPVGGVKPRVDNKVVIANDE